MTKGRKLATAMLAALAMASVAAKANAAQCGSGPGGFEAWKRQFAEEAGLNVKFQRLSGKSDGRGIDDLDCITLLAKEINRATVR